MKLVGFETNQSFPSAKKSDRPHYLQLIGKMAALTHSPAPRTRFRHGFKKMCLSLLSSIQICVLQNKVYV